MEAISPRTTLEQVSADLKIQLVFSTPGIPRGRGRIERFFATLTQMFLCDLPGYVPPKGGMRGKPDDHTSRAGPLVGSISYGGLPQAPTYRDKDFTIGTLGSGRFSAQNA